MDTLSIDQITFGGIVNRGALDLITENLAPFSYDFSFGKSYLLEGNLGDGCWALTRIIAGLVVPDSGTIKRNGVDYSSHDRRRDVWYVRSSQVKRFGFWGSQTVKWQIQYGLRTVKNQYLKTESEVIEHFHLTQERYNRIWWQLSHEGWRASSAVGLVNGKKIFCFPHINASEDDFIESYYDAYLKDMIDLLRDRVY